MVYDNSPNLLLKCDLCDFICARKDEMKKRKTDKHKEVCHKRWTICGKSFHANHELETHLKNHTESERFTCSICDKEFVLNWKLKKHMSVHGTNKYCHYYNNQKNCPFELLGCKFKHEESPLCKFTSCSNPLCQFKHEMDIIEENYDDEIENISEYIKDIDKLVNEYETGRNLDQVDSSRFKTSTPKKETNVKRNECGDCSNQTECVECIMKHVRQGHGGVTTASCTPSPWCLEMDSSPCSTSR